MIVHKVRTTLSGLARRLTPDRMRRPDRPRADAGGTPRADSLAALRQRVDALEHELVESRRLNSRLAELIDVVERVLIPLSRHDDAAVEAALRHVAEPFPPARTEPEGR